MKSITMFQTYDGAVHPSQKAAKHHLDVKHGDLLSRIAGKLAGIDKYVATGDWVDANLDQFLELDRIKKDMTLVVDFSDE